LAQAADLGEAPCRDLCRHGAQVEPVQEGALDVPLEVEEEEDPSPAEEAQEDAPALEVR